jgi:hypothetical protein
MSNRRKLAPHEVAKKDQVLAEASELAKQGKPVIVIDHAAPGFSQCCWCDCPQMVHTCGDPCPEKAEYVVRTSWSPHRYPVCNRHQTGPIEVLAEYESSLGGRPLQLSFRGGWMDDDD